MGEWESTVEDMGINMKDLFGGVYAGKKVLVTGHTGFKGSWLSLWLNALGAEVVGYALPPDTIPSMFEATRLQRQIIHIEGDVRDFDHLHQALTEHKPDMVFHLAAQPLVRLSYEQPRLTYETNIMGTVNLLEAIRTTDTVKVCTVVTSDKCYENHEWVYSYRENDVLGGHDPYSSSKAGAEIIVGSYRRSYFDGQDNAIALASARAGNVIGGGDWALERLVPDAIKALTKGSPILVRNPQAVRPWQFVLEPLSGYLWLAAQTWKMGPVLASAYNFGPGDDVILNVGDMTSRVIKKWGSGTWEDISVFNTDSLHEAHYLQLDCSKSRRLLEWFPVFNIDQAIDSTVDWYKHYYGSPRRDMYNFTLQQIVNYTHEARARKARWAGGTDQNEQ